MKTFKCIGCNSLFDDQEIGSLLLCPLCNGILQEGKFQETEKDKKYQKMSESKKSPKPGEVLISSEETKKEISPEENCMHFFLLLIILLISLACIHVYDNYIHINKNKYISLPEERCPENYKLVVINSTEICVLTDQDSINYVQFKSESTSKDGTIFIRNIIILYRDVEIRRVDHSSEIPANELTTAIAAWNAESISDVYIFLGKVSVQTGDIIRDDILKSEVSTVSTEIEKISLNLERPSFDKNKNDKQHHDIDADKTSHSGWIKKTTILDIPFGMTTYSKWNSNISSRGPPKKVYIIGEIKEYIGPDQYDISKSHNKIIELTKESKEGKESRPVAIRPESSLKTEVGKEYKSEPVESKFRPKEFRSFRMRPGR